MKSLKLFQPFEKGINTVIFYAPKDEPYNEELAKHLFQLRQENYINDWDPSQLDPGSDVDRVLDEKIKKAEIIIFLVSADFLSSPEGEAVRKMALKKRKNFAKIVFVLARPCLYPEAYNEEILLPAKAKAISKQSSHQALDAAEQADLHSPLPHIVREEDDRRRR